MINTALQHFRQLFLHVTFPLVIFQDRFLERDSIMYTSLRHAYKPQSHIVASVEQLLKLLVTLMLIIPGTLRGSDRTTFADFSDEFYVDSCISTAVVKFL